MKATEPITVPRTLFDKVWSQHIVPGARDGFDHPYALYVDLHLIHEVTSPQAFSQLAARGLQVRRPRQTLATMDHSTPTLPVGKTGALPLIDNAAAHQLDRLSANCRDAGITLFGLSSENRGIVHVIGPEQGLTQPGMTVACGDSHTSTHGAFGAFAFGIGTSEVAQVLATQCVLLKRPRRFEIRIDGRLQIGVTAKDLILSIVSRLGTDGGTGHVFEYTGGTVRHLDMEQRMTLCNMSIEAGARAGMIAPDDTTFHYLAGRPYAPRDRAWDESLARWRRLTTDPGAHYHQAMSLDASKLQPMITFGTNPGMAISIRASVPDPDRCADAGQRESIRKALTYMQLPPGKPILGRPVDVVFIGSCTNSRLSDLRAAAGLLQGRSVAPGVRTLVVPGSHQVKREAESEGLDRVFLSAGAEWRDPGCSMCLGMNGDQIKAGQLAVSTSNRNFEGRQGPGGRTILASPLTAAAAAVTGRITDVRELT